MRFYDTSSLLLLSDEVIAESGFAISEITLRELEKIKTSALRDEETKARTRHLLYLLDKNLDKIKVVFYTGQKEYNNDTKIIACAKMIEDEIDCFVSNDVAQKVLAKSFGLKVESVQEETEKYSGYLEVCMTDDELEEFYSNLSFNKYNLYINQYLIIRNSENKVIDQYCWTGTEFRRIEFYTFNSRQFGDIKPIKGDVYQQLLFDSMVNNKITLVAGRPGSGKSWCSLSYLFHLLERGRIDRIIIFCNTVAAKNSARLGLVG